MATTSEARRTLGIMISSSRVPALPTTSMTSSYVQGVSQAFTRTHKTRSPQSRVRIALTTLARAATFSFGATESSRSRKLMSAVDVGALARKRSDEPGVDRHERRGRERERSDMRPSLFSRRINEETSTNFDQPSPSRHGRSANLVLLIREFRSSYVDSRPYGGSEPVAFTT